MPDQKLTPEQVAGFEARAAAGERPALEWEKRFDGRLILREMHTLMIQHTPEDSDAGGYLSIYGLGVCATRFHSYLAAQLAAEHLLAEATRPLHAAALASRDGELAALRARVAELETVILNGLVGDYAALRARAKAAEARARDLEGTVNNQAKDLRTAHEALDESEARVAALEAALAESVSELMNIANVDPSKWDPDERATFRAWAQNRARFTLKNLEEARTGLDAARAGGQGT